MPFLVKDDVVTAHGYEYALDVVRHETYDGIYTTSRVLVRPIGEATLTGIAYDCDEIILHN